MGQYYKPYLRFEDGGEETYCSQNAIFKTVHGIGSEEKLDFRVGENRYRYPDDYFDLFSGLKLLEHSWLGNDFVNGVVERIEGRPAAVAWVGDYADEPQDFERVDGYSEEVYGLLWPREEGDPALPAGRFPAMPEGHGEGFLVNRTKREFIDLESYYKAARKKVDGRWWCLHPLPLLTAIGNGRGGGDYPDRHWHDGKWVNTKNADMVGFWAMDTVEYVRERPSGGYEAVDYGRYAFDSSL